MTSALRFPLQHKTTFQDRAGIVQSISIESVNDYCHSIMKYKYRSGCPWFCFWGARNLPEYKWREEPKSRARPILFIVYGVWNFNRDKITCIAFHWFHGEMF